MSTRTTCVPAPGSFCWYEVNVPDPAKAAAFYGAMFGWTTQEVPIGDFLYHVWMKDNVGFGGIMDTSGPEWQGVPPHWMPYIAVENVDATCERIKELGGSVCVPPTDIPVGRFSVVGDPTGAYFTVFAINEPEPIANEIVWNELVTTDVDAAVTFYTALFGWTTETMAMGDGHDYTMFNNGEVPVGGAMKMDGPAFEGVPPHWASYVGVEDVEASAAKVSEHGGTIVIPPTDIPNNMGRICIFADPLGAHLAMYQPGGSPDCA